MENTRTTLNSHPGVSRQQPRHEVERWDNDSRSNGRGPVETRSLLSVKEAALARLRPGASNPRWRDGRTGVNRQPPIRGGGQENRATAGLVRTNTCGPSVGTQHNEGYEDETYFDDDEENVIVLCDTSHCCNEGAKNLCTIALWGIIALAIFNRFLVHFAGFLQHAPSKD